MRFRGRVAALIGGALSGLLCGLVGNQGGIRAAALLGFDVETQAFVATATAVSTRVVEGPSASSRSVRQTSPTIGKSICMVISCGDEQSRTLKTAFWCSP